MTTISRCMKRLLSRGACAALVAGGALAGKTAMAQAPDAPDKGDAGGAIVGQVRIASDNVKRRRTIVYLAEVPGDYEAPAKPAQVRSEGKAFVPRVLPVLVGTTVVFTNEESFVHRPCNLCLIPKKKAKTIDFGNWSKGDKRSFTFKETGVYTQACSIHEEMTGFVVVLQNPYFALADEDGKFRIADVPAGGHELKVWNEGLRPKQLDKTYDVKVARGGVTNVVVEPERPSLGVATAR